MKIYEFAFNILGQLDQNKDNRISHDELSQLDGKIESQFSNNPKLQAKIQAAALHIIDSTFDNRLPSLNQTYKNIVETFKKDQVNARSYAEAIFSEKPLTRVKCQEYYVWSDCTFETSPMQPKDLRLKAAIASKRVVVNGISAWVHSIKVDGQIVKYPLAEFQSALMTAISKNGDIAPGAYDAVVTLIENLNSNPELLTQFTGNEDLEDLKGQDLSGSIDINFVSIEEDGTTISRFDYQFNLSFSGKESLIGLDDPQRIIMGQYSVNTITERAPIGEGNTAGEPFTFTENNIRTFTEGTRSTITPVDLFFAANITTSALKAGASKLVTHAVSSGSAKTSADNVLHAMAIAKGRIHTSDQKMQELIAALRNTDNIGKSFENIGEELGFSKSYLALKYKRLTDRVGSGESISELQREFIIAYHGMRHSVRPHKDFDAVLNEMRNAQPGEPVVSIARKAGITEHNQPALWAFRLRKAKSNGGLLSPDQNEFLELYNKLTSYNLKR